MAKKQNWWDEHVVTPIDSFFGSAARNTGARGPISLGGHDATYAAPQQAVAKALTPAVRQKAAATPKVDSDVSGLLGSISGALGKAVGALPQPGPPTLSDFVNQFVNQYGNYSTGSNSAVSAALKAAQPGLDQTFANQRTQAQQAYGDAGNRIQSMYNALANDISTKQAPAQAAAFDATNKALGDIGTQAQNTIGGAYGAAEKTLQDTLSRLGISSAEANVIANDPSGALANQQAYQSGNATQNQSRAQTLNTQGKQSEGSFLGNLATAQQQMGVQQNSALQQQLAGLLSQINANQQSADSQLQLQLAQAAQSNTPSLDDLTKMATDIYTNQYGSYSDQASAQAAATKAAQAAASQNQLPASVVAAMVNAISKASTSTTQNDQTANLLNSYNPVLESWLKQYQGDQQ